MQNPGWIRQQIRYLLGKQSVVKDHASQHYSGGGDPVILDEDDFASNSDQLGASQQSIKAHFDPLVLDWLSFKDIFNGMFLETIRAPVTSDGATITLSLDQSGGGDLTMCFSDGQTALDCTPAVTIALTAGGDTSPQKNYIYIPQSSKVLTKSTSDWPSEEHIKIAEVIVQSAATVNTKGVLANRFWNDHTQGTDDQGHLSHAWERMRWEQSAWKSGGAQTLTITPNVGTPDDVDFAVTAAVIYQMHRHTFSAKDTAGEDEILVVNDNATPYTRITDLADLLTDSGGASMSGKYFNLVIWGSISSSTETEDLFVNLPSGSYNKQSDAIADVSGYTNFSIPSDFRGHAFLISKLTLRHQAASGGTWTSIQETDLRGQVPNIIAGGGTAAITTEFADNAFKLFDESDPTKVLAFQLSGITTGNTRTLTIPDESGVIISSVTPDWVELIGGGATTLHSHAGGGGTHDILDGSTHTDSVADAVTRGSIIYGNATPKWDELVLGAADTFLGSDGTDLLYRTAAQVLASLSGEAGAAFDLNGQDLLNGGVIFLTEQAAAEADVPGKGQIWVKTVTPNELWFTDDAGTDFQLGVAAGGGDAFDYYDAGKLPASPSTEDDHFDDDAIAAKWNTFQTGAAVTHSESLHHFQIIHTSEGTANRRGRFQTLPAGDFTIAMKTTCVADSASFSSIALALFEDAAGNPNTCDILVIQVFFQAAAAYIGWSVQRMSDYNSVSTTYVTRFTNIYAAPRNYFRIRRNGTTLYYERSNDGIGWLEFWSHAQPFAPAEMGFLSRNTGGTDLHVFIDWFRYIASDTPGLMGGVRDVA